MDLKIKWVMVHCRILGLLKIFKILNPVILKYKNNLDPTKLWIGANGAWFWAQWTKCSFVDFHPTSPNHTCCISKWENSSASDFTLFLNGICCRNSLHCSAAKFHLVFISKPNKELDNSKLGSTQQQKICWHWLVARIISSQKISSLYARKHHIMEMGGDVTDAGRRRWTNNWR